MSDELHGAPVAPVEPVPAPKVDPDDFDAPEPDWIPVDFESSPVPAPERETK
jgi:hypothetical protein